MEFNDREPIYLQIIEEFKRRMLNGTFVPGQPIPSRREMAKVLGVNPNTVQRAYREMEDSGLITTPRGQESLITTNDEKLSQMREEMVTNLVNDFVNTLRSLKMTDAAIVHRVTKHLTLTEMEDGH